MVKRRDDAIALEVVAIRSEGGGWKFGNFKGALSEVVMGPKVETAKVGNCAPPTLKPPKGAG